MKKIQDLKKGEFLRRKDGAHKTFIRGAYYPATKKYECQNFDDISDFIYLKKDTLVFVDFEF